MIYTVKIEYFDGVVRYIYVAKEIVDRFIRDIGEKVKKVSIVDDGASDSRTRISNSNGPFNWDSTTVVETASTTGGAISSIDTVAYAYDNVTDRSAQVAIPKYDW